MVEALRWCQSRWYHGLINAEFCYCPRSDADCDALEIIRPSDRLALEVGREHPNP